MARKHTKRDTTMLLIGGAVIVAAVLIVYFVLNTPPAVKFPVTGDIVSLKGNELRVTVLSVDHPESKNTVAVYVDASTTIEALKLVAQDGTTTQRFVSQPLSASGLAVGERVSIFPVEPVNSRHITAGHITVLPAILPRVAQ